MPTYKLTYFNGMGRAENTRLMFNLAGQAFEDVRVTREQWQEMKPSSPFGQLPMLEVDGTAVCQSKAIELFVAKRLGLAGATDLDACYCHMIAECLEDMFKPLMASFRETEEKKKETREAYCQNQLPEYLAKFEALLSKSKSGFFIGDSITYADVALFQSVTALPVLDYITMDLSKFPKVAAVVEKVKANKNIAAWLEKRPKTTF